MPLPQKQVGVDLSRVLHNILNRILCPQARFAHSHHSSCLFSTNAHLQTF
jgi:hypothetical protein